MPSTTFWNLPRQSHTKKYYTVFVTRVDSLFNRIPELLSSLASNSTLIRSVFSWASTHAYSAVGFNLNFNKSNLQH